MVVLNTILNVTQRIELVNGILNGGVPFKVGYRLSSIQIVLSYTGVAGKKFYSK